MCVRVILFSICQDIDYLYVGFTPGFVESFDYKDEMAQGTCTSILTDSQPDRVYAVRRTCSDAGGTCDDVCGKLEYVFFFTF